MYRDVKWQIEIIFRDIAAAPSKVLCPMTEGPVNLEDGGARAKININI